MAKAPGVTAKAPDRRRDAWAAFAVALLVRLAVVIWAHARFPAAGDGSYYDVFARRLASGLGYTKLWPDGVVTYVAHYPVGYPALLAAGYAVFGASGAVAMTINALLGAAAAFAMHRLVNTPETDGGGRLCPLGAALAVGLHPALVSYTAAVMTEGVTASLLVIAVALAGGAREGGGGSWRTRATLAAGAVMGIATLVRPQSLLLAPVFGALAAPRVWRAMGGTARARWREAALGAAVVTAVAIACVLPWTARNCVRMHRCALVSVNGGWNLLIGATTPNGGWQPVSVPSECATVWDEAAKDVCFRHAALGVIAQSPLEWLARAPSKVAMTLDTLGATPWYLHESNGAAFDEHAQVVLGAVEAIASRLLLLGALVAVARLRGAWPLVRKVAAVLGAAAALTMHGWLGYVAVALGVLLTGPRAIARAPAIVLATAAVILATVAVHAVFFGSGRYGLVVAPFVAGFAFVRPRQAGQGGAAGLRA
ncbi:MAG TPA: hypothetical protein VK841_02005 [Polyangiaceae bacterium]|nr:hypothetical protein [Polyangiaceae bacterium]